MESAGGRVLSVVIPLRNKAPFLEMCVGSVITAAGQSGDVEIVLVENGSTDGTERSVDTLVTGHVTAVHSEARTAGRARNEGARIARGDVLCFLDADVVVPSHYFANVRQIFESPWVSAAGCTVELPTTTRIERVWGQLHARRIPGLNTSLNGANLCVRRDAFDKAGGFDPSLVTGEDADLCLRLVEAGETVVESPTLSVTHVDNPITLASFFKKEVWRGLGACATARRGRLDKPLFFTIVYTALLVGALALLVAGGGTSRAWIASVTLVSAVPVMTVAYRWSLADSPSGVVHSVLLYHVYFLARAFALLRILGGQHRIETSPEGSSA